MVQARQRQMIGAGRAQLLEAGVAGHGRDGILSDDALVLVGSNPPPSHSGFLYVKDSTIMHSPYVCN